MSARVSKGRGRLTVRAALARKGIASRETRAREFGGRTRARRSKRDDERDANGPRGGDTGAAGRRRGALRAAPPERRRGASRARPARDAPRVRCATPPCVRRRLPREPSPAVAAAAIPRRWSHLGLLERGCRVAARHADVEGEDARRDGGRRALPAAAGGRRRGAQLVGRRDALDVRAADRPDAGVDDLEPHLASGFGSFRQRQEIDTRRRRGASRRRKRQALRESSRRRLKRDMGETGGDRFVEPRHATNMTSSGPLHDDMTVVRNRTEQNKTVGEHMWIPTSWLGNAASSSRT